jgi:lysine/ornithine N-monooxygenase
MKDTALNGRPISRTMMCYTVSADVVLAEYEHSPKNLYRNNQRNSMFGLMERDLEMKQFRPIILNELSGGADMRRCHEAVAFLKE